VALLRVDAALAPLVLVGADRRPHGDHIRQALADATLSPVREPSLLKATEGVGGSDRAPAFGQSWREDRVSGSPRVLTFSNDS
jgi:hypothetical protein